MNGSSKGSVEMYVWLVLLIVALVIAVPQPSSAGAQTPPESASTPLPIDAVTDAEWLVGLSAVPHGDEAVDVDLVRYTFAPGYSLEIRTGNPILIAIEQGTLRVDATGPNVAYGQPRRTTLPDGSIRSHGTGGVKSEGSRLTLEAGGSLSAEDGNVGVIRNAGDEPLVFLMISFSVPPPDMEEEVVDVDDEDSAP